jgi:hypothetical protein
MIKHYLVNQTTEIYIIYYEDASPPPHYHTKDYFLLFKLDENSEYIES